MQEVWTQHANENSVHSTLTHNRYCTKSWLINNNSKNKNNSPRHLSIVRSSFPLDTASSSEDVYSDVSHSFAQVMMQAACYLLCLPAYILEGWQHSYYYIYKKALHPRCDLISGYISPPLRYSWNCSTFYFSNRRKHPFSLLRWLGFWSAVFHTKG